MWKIALFISFLLTSCHAKENNDAEYFAEEFEKGTASTFSKKYDSLHRIISSTTEYHGAKYETKFHYKNQLLNSIKGYFIDSSYGHFLKFNEYGNLELYCYFYGTGKECSYLREYNKEGRLINVKGGPFVDY